MVADWKFDVMFEISCSKKKEKRSLFLFLTCKRLINLIIIVLVTLKYRCSRSYVGNLMLAMS